MGARLNENEDAHQQPAGGFDGPVFKAASPSRPRAKGESKVYAL